MQWNGSPHLMILQGCCILYGYLFEEYNLIPFLISKIKFKQRSSTGIFVVKICHHSHRSEIEI